MNYVGAFILGTIPGLVAGAVREGVLAAQDRGRRTDEEKDTAVREVATMAIVTGGAALLLNSTVDATQRLICCLPSTDKESECGPWEYLKITIIALPTFFTFGFAATAICQSRCGRVFQPVPQRSPSPDDPDPSEAA